DARRGAQSDHRVARLHARGFSWRLRIRGGTRSRPPRKRRRGVLAWYRRSSHFDLRAAAQRALETRTGCRRSRRPEHPGIVPVVQAVAATLGRADAWQLVAGASLSPTYRTHEDGQADLSA